MTAEKLRVALGAGAVLIATLAAGACESGPNSVERRRAASLSEPVLPDSQFAYASARSPLPRHFIFDVSGSAMGDDNTPAGNLVTDAGAALGRVLFYDVRLSANDGLSCASCHQQQFGFGDTSRFSRGANGALMRRHAMALANVRFYRPARFARDERAASLEEQVLRPIRDSREMALPLDAMVRKLRATPYYPALFRAAFGSTEITSDGVARALAQFVRALVSDRARVDALFAGGGPPNLDRLTAQEREGRKLFTGSGGCVRCHRTNALNLDHADNIGLDSVDSDPEVPQGAYKTSSLRNVMVHGPYMHDGRFRTLAEVVDFYDHGIQANPHLDARLRATDGAPLRLHLTRRERDALVAYLATFTDEAFLHDERFADPFVRR